MASNISSGLGVGLARPTSPQKTAGMDIAGKAVGLAQKAAKAGAVKSVKVKVKMAKPKG